MRKEHEMESYYKAKHTYSPENTDELSFKKGLVKINHENSTFSNNFKHFFRRYHQTGEKG